MSKKLPPRKERRAQARFDAKLAGNRERLARLERGGAPDRPIEVESASQVEVHARALRCPRCDGEPRIEEHAAILDAGVRLRVVRARCSMCDARRDIYFRLLTALPN